MIQLIVCVLLAATIGNSWIVWRQLHNRRAQLMFALACAGWSILTVCAFVTTLL